MYKLLIIYDSDLKIQIFRDIDSSQKRSFTIQVPTRHRFVPDTGPSGYRLSRIQVFKSKVSRMNQIVTYLLVELAKESTSRGTFTWLYADIFLRIVYLHNCTAGNLVVPTTVTIART